MPAVSELGQSNDNVRAITLKLLDYCRANNWAGYDPYDALNSKLFKALPLLNFKFSRLVLTQGMKRSPINLRRFLLVPKGQNPKAIALFLSSLVNLSRIGLANQEDVEQMIERLALIRSTGSSYWCWGYNFPWQMRNEIVPSGSPNLVSTVFAANALLDAYNQFQDERCLAMAVSAAEYLLDVLYWTEGQSVAGLRYPLPTDAFKMPVHNANFLGAALLCRVSWHTGNRNFLDAALRVARYSAGKQFADGSWRYGEGTKQTWIDNFHTGYNLCALRDIGRYGATQEFDSHVRKGFEFYSQHFIREDGVAKYFHNQAYPIDIHSVAQSIITLIECRDLDVQNLRLVQQVLRWAIDHMWDRKGFFYYRILRSCTIRTSYMRWSQAWMLLSLSTLLNCEAHADKLLPPAVQAKTLRRGAPSVELSLPRLT
jgi:hypothetical protein